MKNLTTRQIVNFRNHEHHCENCRYYRVHKTGCYTADCLLMGQTLAVSNNSSDFCYWHRGTVCDHWKKRPKSWNIFSSGSDKSPFWKDPYIPRETQKRIRKRVGIEE